ncbi:MAG TPA: NYN domain-containing protein [Thermodesulfobacteriota bacterium]|nr:NYN domain-containing protein [Thermodesulfobacteriota bacterium]
MNEGERTLAVFIDFENIALGLKGKKEKRFDIQKILERLVEKGKIIVKKAYADWADYAEYKKPLHEAAIELIEIPKRSMSGKNSADIRLCVDALDLCYSKEHINTFAIVSGDSDFSPLVSKLKENGKHVIGLGMKDSSSHLLIDNCDEFIYYEDLERAIGTPPKIEQDLPETKKEAFQLLVDSVVALVRENKEVLWSSMVKETMKRKKPSFNESYYGYRTFSDLLEDAESKGLIRLRTDARSGTYVIVGFGKEKKKEEKEALKETKERIELKERKTQKPRWRPRTRKPKAVPPVANAGAESPVAPEPSALESSLQAPPASETSSSDKNP